MFATGKGGTAAGERESQREENDSNCSEFHFFTLSEIYFLECLRAHYPVIIQPGTETNPQEGRH
jgi:hypothetical protein